MKKLSRPLVLVVVLMMVSSLLCCGGPSPAEEAPTTTEEAAPTTTEETVTEYQLAEANEWCDELSGYLDGVPAMSQEVADYCNTFWETWRDGTEEEMLQLAYDHPEMLAKVTQAQGELGSAPAIITEAKTLKLPPWYRDYFASKEEVVNHLSIALQQAEQFLTGVAPMVENMPESISAVNEIVNLWEEIARDVPEAIQAGNYAEAQQKLSAMPATIDTLEEGFRSYYDQIGVPIILLFIDRFPPLGEAVDLCIQYFEAAQAEDVTRMKQLRDEVVAICRAELEILGREIQWDESNAWFEENFGSFLDQMASNIDQAVSLNADAELAFEACWIPTAAESGQVFYAYFTDETGDVGQWEEGVSAPPEIVKGHAEIDIRNAHTRVQGDNIVFWLEVDGSVSDELGIGYGFSVYTTPESKESEVRVSYSRGEASCWVPAIGEYTYIEFQKSDGGLRIIIPKSTFNSPSVWCILVSAFDNSQYEAHKKGFQDTVGEHPPGLEMGE